MGTPGQKYPNKFLNYSENEPAGLEGDITPVGLRQHYFIGNELRARYVDEAQLLHPDYLYTQSNIQTPYNGSNIQSMQAQLMGLWPSSTMNDLNEW